MLIAMHRLSLNRGRRDASEIDRRLTAAI